MASTTETREKNEAILAELTDLSLTLARDLHARALAAEDDKLAAELSLAFHRISRSLRQTLALQSRLDRETRQAERELRQEQARETLAKVQRKREQVRRAVSPLIWTEHEADEDDEAENLFEHLEALISQESFEEDAFLAAPLEACIDRVRKALGLPANDDAMDEADAASPDRQSSA